MKMNWSARDSELVSNEAISIINNQPKGGKKVGLLTAVDQAQKKLLPAWKHRSEANLNGLIYNKKVPSSFRILLLGKSQKLKNPLPAATAAATDSGDTAKATATRICWTEDERNLVAHKVHDLLLNENKDLTFKRSKLRLPAKQYEAQKLVLQSNRWRPKGVFLTTFDRNDLYDRLKKIFAKPHGSGGLFFGYTNDQPVVKKSTEAIPAIPLHWPFGPFTNLEPAPVTEPAMTKSMIDNKAANEAAEIIGNLDLSLIVQGIVQLFSKYQKPAVPTPAAPAFNSSALAAELTKKIDGIYDRVDLAMKQARKASDDKIDEAIRLATSAEKACLDMMALVEANEKQIMSLTRQMNDKAVAPSQVRDKKNLPKILVIGIFKKEHDAFIQFYEGRAEITCQETFNGAVNLNAFNHTFFMTDRCRHKDFYNFKSMMLKDSYTLVCGGHSSVKAGIDEILAKK